jgi:hypothetical protein
VPALSDSVEVVDYSDDLLNQVEDVAEPADFPEIVYPDQDTCSE